MTSPPPPPPPLPNQQQRPKPQQQRPQRPPIIPFRQVVFWYLVFGTIHELSHLFVAKIVLLQLHQQHQLYQLQQGSFYGFSSSSSLSSSSPSSPSSFVAVAAGVVKLIYGITIGRNVPTYYYIYDDDEFDDGDVDNVSSKISSSSTTSHHIQSAASSMTTTTTTTTTMMMMMTIVRHTGWIVSVMVAILVVAWSCQRHNNNNNSSVNNNNNNNIEAEASSHSIARMNVISRIAILTALEAISTDLFQIPVTSFFFLPLYGNDDFNGNDDHDGNDDDNNNHHFYCYCGNFGIILLHHLWWTQSNSRSEAMDTLQTMIRVTMMRGAQCGGVVSYVPTTTTTTTTRKGCRSYDSKNDNNYHHTERRAIVSRVVNRKRTDLSESVRRKVERDVFSPFFSSSSSSCSSSFLKQRSRRSSSNNNNNPSNTTTTTTTNDMMRALTFSGHTRFATSSKATMDGCHPQIWTPASPRRVYHQSHYHHQQQQQHHCVDANNDDGGDGSGSIIVPQTVSVENYITHNGDFDFYTLNGKTYDLTVIQKWLVLVTHVPLQSTVDSLAVAGMIDLLRSSGCFGLSCRYAICLGLPTSHISEDISSNHPNSSSSSSSFPNYAYFESIGTYFEDVLTEMLKTTSLQAIEASVETRNSFALRVASKLQATEQQQQQQKHNFLQPLKQYLTDDEGDASLQAFCLATIHAFFDNDLFWSLSTFLQNAKGSFGLCVTSSLDAHRQLCLAARGQTMSIAFYPNKGLICYGSEQAAVKAGLNATFSPGSEQSDNVLGKSRGDVDDDALRLDLDDLGGEIAVLDWSDPAYNKHVVSRPHRHHIVETMMNGKVRLVLHQESKSTPLGLLFHRMTKLTRNRFVKPLRPETNDLILTDIQDIPQVCAKIQDEWHASKAATSLNRLTAFNLQRCLRDRLDLHIQEKAPVLGIDILLTGCEVSLWLAEQFASDLQKAFPRLRIKAISSNKLLGLFGQELPLPALGHPYAAKTYSLHDSIVIIVSHSGGTFSPLACSNLLQASTMNIFAVVGEFDCQVSKQLRAMDSDQEEHLCSSRIFSTEVGLRTAEPCSVSVVAIHQMLTNLFMYISAVIISDERYKTVTEAVVTETDLQTLEKLNIMNIEALTEIIGCNSRGHVFDEETATLRQLNESGRVWADHILENARAYIMSFVYIFVTVITGYPLAYAIFYAAGMNADSDWVYLIRTVDAAIYFWLPQINITILRLWQRRNLLHRMVGRTVVIGDLPWVAQCAEAFLSKIFAVSYSIAGVNVHSGNPEDHLVHKFTHRVVRGTLLIAGRPDGRLSALSTAEAAVCLSVNQASSIQSWGGTCESVTVGHNPFKLDLTARAIFLKLKRPMFLCERILTEQDAKNEGAEPESKEKSPSQANKRKSFIHSVSSRLSDAFDGNSTKKSSLDRSLNRSLHLFDSSVRPRVNKRRSAAALLGAYVNIQEEGLDKNLSSVNDESVTVDEILVDAIQEKKWSENARKLFRALDTDGDGVLSEKEFVAQCSKISKDLTVDDARRCFFKADEDRSGTLDYDQFVRLLRDSDIEGKLKAPTLTRNDKGIIQIEASTEKYFGEDLRRMNNGGKGVNEVLDFRLAKMQHFCHELYETRIASLQRFVAMVVMFHCVGDSVRRFFATISFGLWDYRMDRTHSIMRIATTASPVSGSDVRQQMRRLRLLNKVNHSVNVISSAYLSYKQRRKDESSPDGEIKSQKEDE